MVNIGKYAVLIKETVERRAIRAIGGFFLFDCLFFLLHFDSEDQEYLT